MRKIRNAGEAGFTGQPIPVEAQAYFARMTTAPSGPYIDALSEAITEWVTQGNWALLKGLWIFCAETQQAALLSVIGDTPRDATITGTPTFTAGKGFSNLGSGVINMGGITSTILGDDNFMAFAAGIVNAPTGDVTYITADTANSVGCLATSLSTVFGNYMTGFVNSAMLGTPGKLCWGGGRHKSFIGGGVAPCITPGGGLGRSSNYRTGSSDLTRLTAYGFLSSTATDDQCCHFMATLGRLVSNLGALD